MIENEMLSAVPVYCGKGSGGAKIVFLSRINKKSGGAFMKAVGFISGLAVGMAAAAAAIAAVYPDVPKRMKRDSKHVWHGIVRKF